MEKLKLNVGQISEGPPNLSNLIYESKGVASESNKRRVHTRPILDDLINWVKEKKFDEYTEKELLKILYTYPQGSLARFPATVNNHVRSIQEKRRRKTVAKREMDKVAMEEQKRMEAIKREPTVRAQQEEEKVQLQREQVEAKEKLEEIREARIAALAAAREKKIKDIESKNQASVAQSEPHPPQPVSEPIKQPTEEERAAAAAALERRRAFADRLRQMTENADDEWMRG